MKHAQFIKLYEDRTASGTWEKWRERHSVWPRMKLLGELPHVTVCNLVLPKGVGSDIKALRQFLLSRYDSASPVVLKPRHDLPPRIVTALLNASGFEWFTKDDRFYIHWTHRIKDQNGQIQKAV